MEPLWRKFYNLSGRGEGGFHLPLSPQPICHVKYHDVLMEVRFRRWPRGEISTPTLPVTLDLLPQRRERRADRGRGRWGGIEGKTRRRPEANPPPCRGIRCFQQSRRSTSAEKEAGPAIDEVWCKTIWAENEMTEVWDTCGGSLPGGTCRLLQDTGRSLCRFGMPQANGLHWADSLSLPPVGFALKIMCKSLFHSRCWCSLWLQRLDFIKRLEEGLQLFLYHIVLSVGVKCVEPPVWHFSNTPALPKQVRHVDAAAQEASRVSKKRKKPKTTLQKSSLTLKSRHEQFPNDLCAAGNMLFCKFCQQNGMYTIHATPQNAVLHTLHSWQKVQKTKQNKMEFQWI